MPYVIKQTREKGKVGYHVCKLDNPKRCFSKHPLTETQAQKQRTAIVLSELRRSRKVGGVRRARDNDPDWRPGNRTPTGTDTDTTTGTDTTTTTGTNTPNTPNARIPAVTTPPAPVRPAARRAILTPDTPITDRQERAARRAAQRDAVLAAAETPIPGHPAPTVTPTRGTRARRNIPVVGVINLPVPSPGENTELERLIELAELETHHGDEAGPSGTITKAQCNAFFDNPKKNPKTNAAIKKNGPKFNELLLECYGAYDHDEYMEKVAGLNLSKSALEDLYNNLRALGILKKERSNPRELDKGTCKEFLENPNRDPILRKRTSLDKFVEYSNKCKEILPEDEYNTNADVYAKNEIPDGLDGAKKCSTLLNDVQIHQLYGLIMTNFFKNNSRTPIDNPVVKRLLKRCDDEFMMKVLMVQMVTGARTNGLSVYDKLVRYIVDNKGDKGGYIALSNLGWIVQDLVIFIFDFRQNEEERKQLLSNLLHAVGTLVDVSTSNQDEAFFKRGEKPKKLFASQQTRDSLVACLYELQALKHGFDIRLQESSSSDRSSKRSKSLDVPQGLADLPKRTRKEILEQLDKACREMRDTISFDDFEDMKKKKLQLVVQIGPKNNEGKQSCYYVKNIYQYVEKELANKKQPNDPSTRTPITREDMKNIILPKMKYVDASIIDPFEKREGLKVPNIKLAVTEIADELGRHFYRVGFIRRIGEYDDNKYGVLGYIPANIYVDENDRGNVAEHFSDVYTGSVDISSTVIMAKLDMLVDQGLLTDMYGLPRVHINKSKAYWYSDSSDKQSIIRKAKSMIDEFDGYLR